MTRYFFDIYDGDHWTRDDIGILCQDTRHARHQGMLALTEMAREYFPFGQAPMQLIVRIRDLERLLQGYELTFDSKPAAVRQ